MRNFKKELVKESIDYMPDNGAEAFLSIITFFNANLYSQDIEMEEFLDDPINLMDLMKLLSTFNSIKDFHAYLEGEK